MQADLLPDGGWSLSNSIAQQLLEKLKNIGTPLGDYVEGKIYRGVLTGLNEAFVIDEATKERLIYEDPRSAEVIKPFLAGRDIKRYQPPKSDKFLIFTRRGINIEEYPAILQHLLQYKVKLTPKPKDWTNSKWSGRKSGPYEWFEIQDSTSYYEEFSKAKILWPGISSEVAAFTIDNKNYFGNDNTNLIIHGDIYLLGVLNATLSKHFLKSICDIVQGGFYRLKISYINKLPDRHSR